jgi:hypothetical protein
MVLKWLLGFSLPTNGYRFDFEIPLINVLPIAILATHTICVLQILRDSTILQEIRGKTENEGEERMIS